MSATDRFLYSGVSWATNAMPSSAAGDPAGSPSSTVTAPADGTVRPTVRFRSVVLPAPFGPTSAVTWPAGTSRVHSRSAHVPPYRLPRPIVSTTFMRFPPFLLTAGRGARPLPGIRRRASHEDHARCRFAGAL